MELRQEKGLIDKECLVLSIEDPELPVGSGGATLNALHIVAEALSARYNHTVRWFIFSHQFQITPR